MARRPPIPLLLVTLACASVDAISDLGDDSYEYEPPDVP